MGFHLTTHTRMSLHLHIQFQPGSATLFRPKHAPCKANSTAYLTTRNIRCLASNQSSDSTATRRSANFQPTLWTHDFVQFLKSDYMDDKYTKRAEMLKEKVRHMLDDENIGSLGRLELIDDVRRLGVGHLFEEEIKTVLYTINSMEENNAKSLHAAALLFRLLRQHGCKVSQDVIGSFKDDNGNFLACLCEDAKGMLSLYEASHLGLQGESHLDEAKVFTSIHLKDMKGNINDPNLAEIVTHALELPLHWRTVRLEAIWYIEAYKKREGMNHVLLELAALDFNMVQSIHQNDLKDMLRWWRDLGIVKKLNFVRDRLMVYFIWTLGVAFEPQFEYCRKGFTKLNAMITMIDDVYDVYGTLDELELFTNAVERWDVNAVEQLPDYMKICFFALYNTINEMAYDTLKEQDWDSISYLKKAWARMCKAHLLEAKWYHSGYTPTLEEYLENACVTVGGPAALLHAYFFVRPEIKKEAIECIESHPDLILWSSLIVRLCDDLGTSTAELERGDVPKSIQCYMHEAGVSEDVAREHIRQLISDAWKKMNGYQVSDCPNFPQALIKMALDFARTSQFIYQYGDGHSIEDRVTKDRVLSLLVEPIYVD